MFEERGLGNKNINPVKVSLSNRVLKWLKDFSKKCDLRWSVLARYCIIICMEDPNLMKKLQDRFHVVPDKELYTIPENKGFKIYGE